MTDTALPPQYACRRDVGDNGPGRCWTCEQNRNVHLCKFDLYRCATCCHEDATREPRLPQDPTTSVDSLDEAMGAAWNPLETNPGVMA